MPNDNMLHLAELSTGLSLALIMQNKPATEKLEAALEAAAAQTSNT
jgi:hypothetical protein